VTAFGEEFSSWPHAKCGRGKGTGNTCLICAKTISADEVENEVVIRGSGVALKLCAHLPCLNIWRSESEMFEANGPDAPAQSA